MDKRDSWTQRHHRRRLEACQKVSIMRAIRDADRQLDIARSHHRTTMIMMLVLWRAELKKQLSR